MVKISYRAATGCLPFIILEERVAILKIIRCYNRLLSALLKMGHPDDELSQFSSKITGLVSHTRRISPLVLPGSSQ